LIDCGGAQKSELNKASTPRRIPAPRKNVRIDGELFMPELRSRAQERSTSGRRGHTRHTTSNVNSSDSRNGVAVNAMGMAKKLKYILATTNAVVSGCGSAACKCLATDNAELGKVGKIDSPLRRLSCVVTTSVRSELAWWPSLLSR
jgi:hypothetical protein